MSNYDVSNEKRETSPDDKGSVGFGILSFFIPLVGLILFLVWHKEKPRKAKLAGIGAIIGIAANIIFYLVAYGQFIAPLLARV
jgi:drug/metabolite transporter (DMT)-like permease